MFVAPGIGAALGLQLFRSTGGQDVEQEGIAAVLLGGEFGGAACHGGLQPFAVAAQVALADAHETEEQQEGAGTTGRRGRWWSPRTVVRW